jgi:hypothetical protein
VKKQNRGAIAADEHINCRATGLDRLTSKSRKEVHWASGGLSKSGRTLCGRSSGNYAKQL